MSKKTQRKIKRLEKKHNKIVDKRKQEERQYKKNTTKKL